MSTASLQCLKCKNRVQYRRGQSLRCYNQSGRDVAKRSTTWAKLEAAGEALPSAKEISRQKLRRQWL